MAANYNWDSSETASLFERIQGKSSGSSHHARMDALVRSIKNNLNQILNSRPDACQSSASLGVPDLNDATQAATDFRRSLEHSITTCIQDFEPRISNVRVTFIENDADALLLQFSITAFIDLDSQRQLIEFNMQLDNNRRYQLKQF
ncbi:TPA: type VI secretion system baseplate subunit TssE [Providencia stuartii]|uniref:Type VI secretion system baseplate subunit TssE n=4 Tax=Gammaproteobacteria TaxID=1236 RepID=A0AAJ1JI43_PROST|nr:MULTISPECIES: type VI secretion system baseplate subunit TssE [Providencia]AFH93780.1 hypothetical protein S70_09600 [Providencia stuartii MRSN 2154]AIN66052.1 25-like lysozyme family protein [Providencia stuartii]AMG67858.1 type VI secretion system baseplate subunit TssE [Providencia stuartii]APG51743.1 lysozyme [Providencia stuartii]AVE41512.1 type VI secretion system baseplate subunit TssE [Providencia stuartii]